MRSRSSFGSLMLASMLSRSGITFCIKRIFLSDGENGTKVKQETVAVKASFVKDRKKNNLKWEQLNKLVGIRQYSEAVFGPDLWFKLKNGYICSPPEVKILKMEIPGEKVR